MAVVVVIGGGASGMCAALSAAGDPQNQVLLFERQSRVGRKLLSTGNGRCNLTNLAISPQHYHGESPDFPEFILKKYSSAYIIDFFEQLGLLTVSEPDGRVYPLSNQANSVVDVLRFALDSVGVELHPSAPVKALYRTENGYTIETDAESVYANYVIVACGGAAGGKVGGVMDGYTLLKSLGHRRTGLYPSLTQLKTDTVYPRALKGVKADAKIRLSAGDDTQAEMCGEVLFTETGVSGPAIFGLSRNAATGASGLCLHFDFFREYPRDNLLSLLKARRTRFPQLEAAALFTGMLHSRLGQCIVKYAGIPGGTTACAQLTDAQLRSAVHAAKDFRLTVTGNGGLENAQVTAGGMRTDEFNPETLESLLCPGVFACGEVLDVDGDCGGFNLQWAWASGLQAGRLGK